LLSAARSVNFKAGSISASTSNTTPEISRDEAAVIILSLLCLVIPLIIVAGWHLHSVQRPVVQLMVRVWRLIARLAAHARGKLFSCTGASESRATQAPSSDYLLSPKAAS